MGLSFYIGSYPVFIYSFLARGYLLLLLFYIVAFYAIFQITVEQKSNKRYYYLFAISAVAGFYTIPSFLYAFAGSLLFALPFLWLQKRKHELVCLFKTVVLVFLVVLLLYTPVLISVNWGLLKPYFNPVYQLHETGRAFSNTFTVMAKSFLSPAFFMALLTGIFFIAGSVIYFLKRKISNRQIVVFVWLQLLLSFAVFFGFKQQFPAKPWMHFVVLSAILLAAVFNLIIKRFGYHRFLLVFTVLFFIISGTIISFNYKNKSTVATGYNSIAKKCEKIMIEKGVKEIYTDIPYFKTMIEYYSIKNHLQTTIYNSRAKSSKFAIFDQYKRYELIITYLNHSKLPSLLYNYDTVLQQNNTVVLLIRQ